MARGSARTTCATEAYGAVDEAVAALGLARAELSVMAQDAPLAPGLEALRATVLRLQRELFVVGAELATNPDARDKGSDDVSRVSGGDGRRASTRCSGTPRRGSSCPGSSSSRARPDCRPPSSWPERSCDAPSAVRLRCRSTIRRWPEAGASQYLNRLADLLWVLARDAEQAEAHAATVARPDRRRPGTRTGESEERSQG